MLSAQRFEYERLLSEMEYRERSFHELMGRDPNPFEEEMLRLLSTRSGHTGTMEKVKLLEGYSQQNYESWDITIFLKRKGFRVRYDRDHGLWIKVTDEVKEESATLVSLHNSMKVFEASKVMVIKTVIGE